MRPQQTLAPGEGAFIRNPTNPFSITFTGTPPTNFAASATPGYNILGVLADGTRPLSPRDNDQLRVWDTTQENYGPILIASEGIWYSAMTGVPVEPPLRAGESFFYYRTGSLGDPFTISPGPEWHPPVNLVGLEPFTIGPITPYWPTPWSTSPTNAVVVEGQSAQFQTGPFGLPIGDWDLQTYQWQRETLPNTWTDILGETSSILRIPAVQKADAGRYRVVGQFDCKSGVSLPSVVTVIDRPELKAAIALAGNQTVMLSGIVPTGLSYQIEESFDLSHWTNFAAITSPPESWSVLVTNVPDFSRRFFRVRSVP